MKQAGSLNLGMSHFWTIKNTQRSIHVVAETWKTPTQARINTTIPAQAWKKHLEREMLPKEQVKQDIYSKCIYYVFMLRLFRAYSVHNSVPRSTLSTLTLELFDYPHLRWNPQYAAQSLARYPSTIEKAVQMLWINLWKSCAKTRHVFTSHLFQPLSPLPKCLHPHVVLDE